METPNFVNKREEVKYASEVENLLREHNYEYK